MSESGVDDKTEVLNFDIGYNTGSSAHSALSMQEHPQVAEVTESIASLRSAASAHSRALRAGGREADGEAEPQQEPGTLPELRRRRRRRRRRSRSRSRPKPAPQQAVAGAAASGAGARRSRRRCEAAHHTGVSSPIPRVVPVALSGAAGRLRVLLHARRHISKHSETP